MSSLVNTNFQNPSPHAISSRAEETIKTRTRFTDYLAPEIWPLCRHNMYEL